MEHSELNKRGERERIAIAQEYGTTYMQDLNKGVKSKAMEKSYLKDAWTQVCKLPSCDAGMTTCGDCVMRYQPQVHE